MKRALYLKRVFLLSIALILTAGFSYAQRNGSAATRVIVSTKTIYLHKEKNERYPHVLKMPVVSDAYPNLKKALSDTALFDGMTLVELIKEHDSVITGSEYEVTFSNRDILSIVIRNETNGTYPYFYEKWLSFNIRTGEQYPISNEISPEGINWIFGSYKKLMKKHILQDYEQRAKEKNPTHKEDKDTFDDLNRSIDELTVKELTERYLFTKNGIRFTTEDVLPRVIRAFEMDRIYTIPYFTLKKYRTPTAIILK